MGLKYNALRLPDGIRTAGNKEKAPHFAVLFELPKLT
jgi:hypothetical protein